LVPVSDKPLININVQIAKRREKAENAGKDSGKELPSDKGKIDAKKEETPETEDKDKYRSVLTT
jgi:hypothetical protein